VDVLARVYLPARFAFHDLQMAHEDGLTAQLLRESGVDSARSNAWTSALVTYAVTRRPENLSVLDNWTEKWRPEAERAAGALKQLLP
jgi:toluene monooxygenase system protein E